MWIIFVLIIVAEGFALWNLLQKVEALEDDNDFLQKWSSAATEEISSILETIHEIDNKGYFEEDDEVGVVFTRFKEAINSLDNFLE